MYYETKEVGNNHDNDEMARFIKGKWSKYGALKLRKKSMWRWGSGQPSWTLLKDQHDEDRDQITGLDNMKFRDYCDISSFTGIMELEVKLSRLINEGNK